MLFFTKIKEMCFIVVCIIVLLFFCRGGGGNKVGKEECPNLTKMRNS